MKLRSYQNKYLGEYFTYDVNNIYEAIVALNLSKKGIEKEINVDKYTAKIQQMKVQESKYGLDKLLKMKKIQLITNKSELKEDYSYIRYENNKYSPIILRKNIIQQKGGRYKGVCKLIKQLPANHPLNENQVVNCCKPEDDNQNTTSCNHIDGEIKKQIEEAAVLNALNTDKIKEAAKAAKAAEAAEAAKAAEAAEAAEAAAETASETAEAVAEAAEAAAKAAEAAAEAAAKAAKAAEAAAKAAEADILSVEEVVKVIAASQEVSAEAAAKAVAEAAANAKEADLNQIIDIMGSTLVQNFFKDNSDLYKSFLIQIEENEKKKTILPYVSLSEYNELCDCILYMDLLNTETPGQGGAGPSSKPKRSPKKKVNLDELIESLTPKEITTLRGKLGYTDISSDSEIDLDDRFKDDTPSTYGTPSPSIDTLTPEQKKPIKQRYHLRYILSILFSFFIGVLIMWCRHSFTNNEYKQATPTNELTFKIEKFPLQLSSVSTPITITVDPNKKDTLAGHIYDYIDNAYNPKELDTSSCTINQKTFKELSPFEKTFIRNTEVFQTYIEYRAFLVDNNIVLTDTPPPQGVVTNALTTLKTSIETTINESTLNTLYENFNELFQDGSVAPLQFIKNIALNHKNINPVTKMKFLRLHETIVRWKEDIHNEVPVPTTNPCKGNGAANTIFIKMHQMGFVQRMVNHYVDETKETLTEFEKDFEPFFTTLIAATRDTTEKGTKNIIELNNKLDTALTETTSTEIKQLFAKPKAVLDEYDKLTQASTYKTKEAIEKIKYMMIQTFPTFEKSKARAEMIDKYKGYISNALFMSGKFTGTTAYQIVHGISKAENDVKASLPQIMEDISFEILESIDKSIIRSYDINALNHISAKMFSSIGQKLISRVLPIYKDAFSINFIMEQINGLTSVGYGNSVSTVLNIFHSAIIRLNAEKEIHLLRMKDPISYIDMLKKFYELSQTANKDVPKLLHGSSLEYVDMMLKISKLDIAIGMLKLQYDILNTRENSQTPHTFEHLSMVGHPDIFGQNDNTGLEKYAPFFVEKGSHIMALVAYSSSFTSTNSGGGITGGKKLEDKLINAFIENAEANHKPTMNKLTSKKQINDTLKKKLFNSLMKSNPRLFKSIKEYESSVV
jgi:hypothetical protein